MAESPFAPMAPIAGMTFGQRCCAAPSREREAGWAARQGGRVGRAGLAKSFRGELVGLPPLRSPGSLQ